MHGWRPRLTISVAALALAGFGLPAQAEAVRCEFAASPPNAEASSRAFARDDVRFATTAEIRCFDGSDSPVAADPVCLSAWREEVSNTTDLHRDGTTIAYQVETNDVLVTAEEQQVWSGAVEASGRSLAVNFLVRASDFAGFPSGSYYGSTAWVVHLNTDFCP